MSIEFSDSEKKDLGITTLDKESNPKQSKKKVRCITFSLNNPVQIEYAIKMMESEFNTKEMKYLYILHDKDEGEDGLIDTHLHAIVWGTPRRFVDWADLFSIPDDEVNAIPPHMICRVMRPRSMARYLIHKDNPEKHQYSPDEVCGSNKGLEFFKTSLLDVDSIDLDSEVEDFSALRFGKMTPTEYLRKYRVFYAGDSFSNRIRMYNSIFENFNKMGGREIKDD